MKPGAFYGIVISILESFPNMQLDLPPIKHTEVVNLDKVLVKFLLYQIEGPWYPHCQEAIIQPSTNDVSTFVYHRELPI